MGFALNDRQIFPELFLYGLNYIIVKLDKTVSFESFEIPFRIKRADRKSICVSLLVSVKYLQMRVQTNR